MQEGSGDGEDRPFSSNIKSARAPAPQLPKSVLDTSHGSAGILWHQIGRTCTKPFRGSLPA
jgi:hypothetical protein